jgi:hypothetical protein
MRVWDHFRQQASRPDEALGFPIAGKAFQGRFPRGLGVTVAGYHSLSEVEFR